MLEPKNEKNTHSSHARPKTKASGQLVGIADYMGASLEVNDKHTMHMYMNMCHEHVHMLFIYFMYMCHDIFANIQTGLLLTYNV